MAGLVFSVGTPSPDAIARAAEGETNPRLELVQCANLVYAGSKSSRCFSDKFLKELSDISFVDADTAFTPVKAGTEDLFNYPFSIMTGEGNFSLFEEERKNIKSYLERGGFLLASAGCSSPEWDRSFRREFKIMYPEAELIKIPMDHAIFRSVYEVERIWLKNGGTTLLEGFEMNGKIVLIYASEGLNDVPSVQGCCCCGGNEIRNSKEINTNIISYALTH